MKKKILYMVATIIVAIASFVYGRYDITWGYAVHEDGTEDSFETPQFTSYKAIAERNVESTCILMDIIDDIYVKEEYRQSHIASILLDYMISNSKITQKIMLEVEEDNIKAINLYQKFGRFYK